MGITDPAFMAPELERIRVHDITVRFHEATDSAAPATNTTTAVTPEGVPVAGPLQAHPAVTPLPGSAPSDQAVSIEVLGYRGALE